MKKVFLSILLAVAGMNSFAQAPEKISYQAIVRYNSGLSVVNSLVGVRVAILSGSSLGPEVFAETHGPTTNSYGLINIQIGAGANTGPALSTIDWSANVYFVKVDIDPTGGTSYSVTSVSQLLSVPYALYAKNAGNVNDADADPTNELNTGAALNGDNLEITDAGGTLVVDMAALKLDPDMSVTNEIQTLSKVGQVVSLSLGGGAFTDDVNDADSDPNNEVNTSFVLVGTTLQITDAAGTLNADLSSLSGDADADPFNEIQFISKVGSTVTLSLGGGSFTDAVDDADNNPTNELQTISKVGSTVTLSNGGGSFIDAVNDADFNPTNELQTVSKVGNTVTLSNGGGSFTVDDADASATNEFNLSATLVGTNLNITDGGGTLVVDLASISGGSSFNLSATLVGTDLNITDGGGTLVVDLSSLQDGVNDADADPTNEFNTSATLVGTDLNITDGGGTLVVDMSSLSGGGSSFRVGQFYQGGIIVYVDSTGIGGLIAAPADVGGLIEFEDVGNGNALLAYGPSFTDGQANCAAFLAAPEAVEYFAVQAADGYSNGGFSDWYLPSLFELEFILQNNYVLAMHGAAMSWGGWYWSSTDFNTVGFNAYQGNGSTQSTQQQSQGTTARVRPVRAF